MIMISAWKANQEPGTSDVPKWHIKKLYEKRIAVCFFEMVPGKI